MKRKPLIAIIGRPNVGKSTLFNRILKFAKAIVEDTPGVTRDRNYEEASFLNRPFILIDTGGFDPSPADEILTLMKNQVQLAMEEADAILFLMDAKEGLCHTDKAIVNFLRPLKKKVYYVVNKVESQRDESSFYEFYSLGLEPLYSISALNGDGVESLLSELTADMEEATEGEGTDEEMTKVAVIGRPNTGKSSLINFLLNADRLIVSDVPGTTRDSIDSVVTYYQKKYLFIDTAGIRRKRSISLGLERFSVVKALVSVLRADVALLVLDATTEVSEQDAKIAAFADEKGKGLIILVNKWDLIPKNNHSTHDFIRWIRTEMKFVAYAPVLFISAKTGQRVTSIFKQVDQVKEETHRRIPTADLNRFFEKRILAGHPLPLYKGRRVKLFYAAQIKVAPPTIAVVTNCPEGVPPSYQRYIINQFRETYGFAGSPLKIIFQPKSVSKKR